MGLDDRRDEELARLAQGGEVAAFGTLVGRHQRRIYGLMLRMTRDPGTAEDLAQDVFLRAFRSLRSFDADAAFAPWIYRIAVNRLNDWGAARRRVPVPDDLAALDLHDPQPSPERLASDRQVVDVVQQGIFELPAPMQQALLLRHRMGLGYGEIAEVMNLPLGTVKTHLHRARARLREVFDRMTMEEPCAAKK